MNAYPFSLLVDHQKEIREFVSREEIHRRMNRPVSNRSTSRVLNLLLAVMLVAATPWR